jgi:prepilin-type N-terminal cleavage/methylation domain-containing protein
MSNPMHQPAVIPQRPIQEQVRSDPWISRKGFTLVELVLALGLGLLVAAWVVEALLGHANFSAKLVDRLQQREFVRRARRLIEDDRRLAILASSQPGAQAPACNLAGRQPLLHLQLPASKPAITWSLGTAPSAIWRGQVLMRCGPAYDLDGKPNLDGSWQNRVVLDRAQGFDIPM